MGRVLILLVIALAVSLGARADNETEPNPYAPVGPDYPTLIKNLAENSNRSSADAFGLGALNAGVGAVLGLIFAEASGYEGHDWAFKVGLAVSSGAALAIPGLLAPDKLRRRLSEMNPLSYQNQLFRLLVNLKRQGYLLPAEDAATIIGSMPNAKCEAALKALMDQ